MPKRNQDPIPLLIDDLESRTGGTFFLMEDVDLSWPAAPSAAWLLERDHMLLSKPVATLAIKVRRQLFMDNADGAIRFYNTTTGDQTWDIMFSLMTKVKKDIKKMDWTASLGRLLGILLYATEEDCWIQDNEVWEDQKKFTKWFSDYSEAWKGVLKQTDHQLGLALQGGKLGGYRSALTEVMKKWQIDTNHLLDDLYNGKKNHNFNVKVNIILEQGKKGQDANSTNLGIGVDGSSKCDVEPMSKKLKKASNTPKSSQADVQPIGKSKGKAKGKHLNKKKSKKSQNSS